MKPAVGGNTTVVVVGGGFAGINAAKKLCRMKGRDGEPIQVTIIDRRNHHLFQPLLYQVATAGLSPADIAMPIRALFKERNVQVVLDEVVAVDGAANLVRGRASVYPYDYLIVACGASHSYFGRDDWEEFAPGLKTLEQATEIRRRILSSFEEAEKSSTVAAVAPWTTFVVVGGGPTGVEMAGAISELARNTVKGEYRRFEPGASRILLIEAGPRLLAGMDPSLSVRAFADLQELGVEVRLNTRVEGIEAQGVKLTHETIPSRTVVWAAGVAPSALGKTLGTDLDPAGRVIVQPDLTLAKFKNIFVLGDQANFKDPETGKPLPGLAPVAMQQGRHAARNIERLIQGAPTETFTYLDKGSMATIGRSRAVMQSGGIKIGGFIAWVGWLFIHIYYLIGFKNRLFVLMQWVWSYLTFSRGARLIVDKDWHLKK
ncbi:MAG: NAD(P)/FAD-dependent oxidoreductase [Bdellovibrionales bacterium]|nr:NAD(P)/FAD-dependent oxidoreductase [Bdellovibrionales bacterium]